VKVRSMVTGVDGDTYIYVKSGKNRQTNKQTINQSINQSCKSITISLFERCECPEKGTKFGRTSREA
jgi:hypothetical protein